jgi:hypothetical protein
MRKAIFLTALALFLSPTLAIATSGSGACSSHGGVNCNAGPDWDGSATCNDGWTDSSVFYYDIKECTNNLHYCTQTESDSLSAKYKIDSFKQVGLDDNAALNTLMQKEAATTDTNTLRQLAIDALTLNSTISKHNLDLRVAMTGFYKECYALGETEFYQSQAEFLKTLQTQQTQTVQQTEQPVQTPQQSAPPAPQSAPVVDSIDFCSQKLGPHGVVAGQSKCACASGYVLNDQQNNCVVAPAAALVVTSPLKTPTVYGGVKPPVHRVSEDTISITASTSATTNAPTMASPKQSFWSKVLSWFKWW